MIIKPAKHTKGQKMSERARRACNKLNPPERLRLRKIASGVITKTVTQAANTARLAVFHSRRTQSQPVTVQIQCEEAVATAEDLAALLAQRRRAYIQIGDALLPVVLRSSDAAF